MTSVTTPPGPEEINIERDLLAHYTNIQLLGKYLLPIAIIINSVAFLVWESWKPVAIWTFFTLSFWIFSLYMCHRFQQVQNEVGHKDLKAWYIYIGAPRVAYNLMWFTLPFWAWTPDHPETYFIIIAILVSTIAMNAAQSAAVIPFYLLEAVPKFMGIVISAFMNDNYLQYTIAILSVTASLLFTKIAFGMNRSVRLILLQKYELIKAKEEVERASRAKTSFLATMSHEVRTPLNGILGVVNLMKYTTLNKQQDEYVETMRYSGETLLAMLNDILDFSKMESGKLDLEEVPFETSRLIDSVRDLLGSRASEKNLFIETQIFDDVPPFLKTDPTRLRQVLLNLMSNAIKFTDEGGITVTVRAVEEKHEKRPERLMLRFEVADTGIGIPPEARQHLFEDFTQVDSSTARKYGGSGLGLSICRRIIDMMQGRIDFDSTQGEGSRFWFVIPVAPSCEEEVSSFNEKGEDFPELKPLDILLAEDNVINQKVAAGLLGKYNHRIDIANNGEEAVEAVKRKKYDLVLMDMQMPVTDGLQATKKIRQMGGDFAALPIVALSANSLIEEDIDYASAGITDHVTKPLRLSHLFRTFAIHLPGHVLKS